MSKGGIYQRQMPCWLFKKKKKHKKAHWVVAAHQEGLTCAGSPVGEESVPGVTPADRPLFCVLAGVLATSVAMVTGHYRASTNHESFLPSPGVYLVICVCDYVLGW